MKTALRFHISQESVGETSLNPGSHIGNTLCCEAIRALNNLTLISIKEVMIWLSDTDFFFTSPS